MSAGCCTAGAAARRLASCSCSRALFSSSALATAYALYQDTAWLSALFFGLKAAVLAIVADALVRVSKRALKNKAMYAIAAAAFMALFMFDAPFPLVIVRGRP